MPLVLISPGSAGFAARSQGELPLKRLLLSEGIQARGLHVAGKDIPMPQNHSMSAES